jgi:P-type conjugative transfer protein TrbJ
MRKCQRTLLALLVALVFTSTPAHAQFIVFDPSNFGQNTLTAARSLMEVNNQILQLENEATMLLNEARNLTSLPFSIVAQLRATLARTTALINQAQGIAYQLAQARAQFDGNYPANYTSGVTGATMFGDTQIRWFNSLQALRTTVAMQAQAAENLSSDEDSLATLVAHSQDAIGALQAMQATNQLLALQSRQTIQDQQLRLTQDRAVALEQARVVAEEARAREVRRRFLGDGVRYTPQTIGGFGF